MKKITTCFFASLSLCMVASLYAQPSKKITVKTYTLSGTITDLKDGKMYLTNADGEEKKTDSTQLKDGKFTFTGKLDEPMLYYLKIAGTQRGQIGIFLEPTVMTVTGSKDSLYTATVTGSATQTQWRKVWGADWARITAQAGPHYRRLDSAIKANSDGKTPTAGDQKIFDDSIELVNQQLHAAVLSFISKYPSSPVSPFIIQDRYINYPNPEMAAKTFAMLDEKAKNSFYGRQISEYQRIAAKTALGATPDFEVADTSGKPMKLSALRGKYVLVDFWASWCGPCRKENPNVVKAYNTYHNKGFEIVGVSLDTKKDAWLKAIDKDSLTWNHVSDLKGWESVIVKEYGIRSVPTGFLLDKEGKVIANNLRAEALQEKLHALLN